MPIPNGQRLGPFEILASIGAGGMGEVYRARDTRLNRDVAIKVLPQSFAEDNDRLRRFQLEAQSAGALNHPNILTVFDVGADVKNPYLVSELLEGETLRDKLRQSKIPTLKAIDYARQIAAGLAAAHGKGITHRDIKPENLFVTKDGRVKILDFGLAKVAAPARNHGESTTETRATDPGAVMGTASYMSPEQVRAQPIDHRSDIFSLGCVLYEMLAGKRAFHGDTSVETMNAILKEDPPDLATLDASLPPALDRIVRHCLEKSPDERFQSARDLAFDLDSVTQVSGKGPGSAAASASAKRRNWIPWSVAALCLIAGTGAGYWGALRLESREQPKFQRLTFRHGMVRGARFAPDGNTIVYTADWAGTGLKTYSVRLDSPEFHPTVLDNATLTSVSSSGELAVLLDPRTVAFQTLGTLSRVPFSGGAPRQVLEQVQFADWSPKGELAIVRDGPKENQLEFPVGKVLFHTAGFISHIRFSPEGDYIAFLHHPLKTGDDGQVMVVTLDGQAKTLSSGWGSLWGLAWMPRTNEVCFTATKGGSKRELRAVSLKGVERTILAQTGNLTLEDIARDGRVLLNSATQQMKLNFVTGVEAGKPPKSTRELSWLDWSLVTGISNDAKSVVFFESGEGAGDQVVSYYRKTDGSPAVKLGPGENPALSPDGKWVVVVGLKYDEIDVLPVGPGEAKRFPIAGISVNVPFWLPNGKDILFAGSEPGHGLRVYIMPAEGGKPRAISPEGLTSSNLVIMPDGRHYVATDANRKNVVYSVDGGAAQPCLGIEDTERPYTSNEDGSILYVMRRGAVPAPIYRVQWKTGKREFWNEINPADSAGVNDVSGVRLTPDGKSYAYSYVQELSELHLVEGLK